jgi:hypothetical protein
MAALCEIDAIIFSGINDISRIFRFKSALRHPTNFPRNKMTWPNKAWMQKWGGIRMERTALRLNIWREATGCRNPLKTIDGSRKFQAKSYELRRSPQQR